jgi:hypothetical protein
VTWGVCNFEDFTIFNFEKFSLHSRLSQQLPKSKIFIITKIPPPHEKGEGYE